MKMSGNNKKSEYVQKMGNEVKEEILMSLKYGNTIQVQEV